MRVFGLLFCILSLPLFASTAFAATTSAATKVTTQIYDVDYGRTSKDHVLVFLMNGQVAKLRQSHSFIEKGFEKANSPRGGDWVTIKMDKKRFITDIQPAKAPAKNVSLVPMDTKSIQDEYVMTTLPDMSTAKKYFSEQRYNPKESQCFNRAMVWTYEWWKNHSFKSGKLLIYFTRNYIRRYDFEWWFHITPYIHVMDNGKVVERTMDRKYTRGPLAFRDWTNIFMRNDAPCPVITKFSDYADYPYSGECFLQRTHMFTYQPADLQMYEAWGYHKENFNMDEVRGAYLEAFDERL